MMNIEQGMMNNEGVPMILTDLLLHSTFLVLLFDISLVRVEGLEPPCLTAPDPKSGTSTNFATPAIRAANVGHFALQKDAHH